VAGRFAELQLLLRRQEVYDIEFQGKIVAKNSTPLVAATFRRGVSPDIAVVHFMHTAAKS